MSNTTLYGFRLDSIQFCIDLASIRFNALGELIEVGSPLTGIQLDSAAGLLGLNSGGLRKVLDKNAEDWELIFGDDLVAVKESCFKRLAINALCKGNTRAEKVVELLATHGVFGLFLSHYWGNQLAPMLHLLGNAPTSNHKDFIADRSRTKSSDEKKIQIRLSQLLGGRMEVFTPSGNIDILTSTEIIEVKRCSEWKDALGQVLAYGYHHPELRKRIHLFGRPHSLSQKTEIEKVCKQFGVMVTYELHY